MKKRVLNKIEQLVAGITLLGASAQAEWIDVSPERLLIRIKFDEPIVSKTVVDTARTERYRNKKSPPQDLGLDLFEVTGAPAHQPKVHWEDQNRLLIAVAKGTSVATEFRLAFKPRVTYLSGKALAQREFRFHAPGTHLETDRPLELVRQGIPIRARGFAEKHVGGGGRADGGVGTKMMYKGQCIRLRLCVASVFANATP